MHPDSVTEHTFARQAPATAPLVSLDVARYRCTACGNVTRFDVTATRRTRAYHHYNLAGEVTVEDEEVLSETVDEVSCRWCGTGSSVERLSDDASEGASA